MGKAIPDWADIVTNAQVSHIEDDPALLRPDPRTRKAIARAAQKARQPNQPETGGSSSDDSGPALTPPEPSCNCGGGMPHSHHHSEMPSAQEDFGVTAGQNPIDRYHEIMYGEQSATGQGTFLQQEGYTFPTSAANRTSGYSQAHTLDYFPQLGGDVSTHFSANSGCAKGTLANLYPVSIVTPDRGLTSDNCQCSSEATCTCEGCIDHPRNRATMSHVMEMCDWVATHPECLEDNAGGEQTDEIPEEILRRLPVPSAPLETPRITQGSTQSGQSGSGGCCGSKRQATSTTTSSSGQSNSGGCCGSKRQATPTTTSSNQAAQQAQTASAAPPNPLTLQSTYNPNIHRQPSLTNLNQSLLNTPLNTQVAQQHQPHNASLPNSATTIPSSMTSTPTGFYGYGPVQDYMPFPGPGQTMSSSAMQHYITQGFPIDSETANNMWIAAHNPYAAGPSADMLQANNIDMSAYLHGDPMMGAPAFNVHGAEQHKQQGSSQSS